MMFSLDEKVQVIKLIKSGTEMKLDIKKEFSLSPSALSTN